MEPSYDKKVQHPYLSKPRYVHLSKGSKVEVTSRSEGFVGSWFEATVVKPPEHPKSSLKSKRLTLVEYVNLVNEEGTLLLREKVDVVLLRPIPPKVVVVGDEGFREGDLVDCFERDGWWTGVVKSVVGVRDMDKEEEERYLVRFDDPVHEIEFGREDLRVHLDWMEGKWFRFRDNVLQELSITSYGHVTLANNISRSGPKELVESGRPVVIGINADCCTEVMPFIDEQATRWDLNRSPGLSASFQRETISLEHPNSSSTHSPPAKKLKKPCADPLVLVSTKPAELTIEDSDVASLCITRALGWRDNVINPLRDCQHKETGGKSYPRVKNNENGHFKGGFKRRKTKKQLSEGIPIALAGAEVEEVDGIHKNQSMEEHSPMAVGREFTYEKQGEVQVHENVHKNPCMEEQSLVSVGTEMTHKGQGELQKVENVQANPSLELVAVGTEVTQEEQGTSNLANDAMRLGTEGTVVARNEGQFLSNDVNGVSQSLPFVKTSPIWKAVEALEMFRLFPQKPHFLPLIDARERTREGLAIAKMVTFATTVENVIKLSVHSPVSCFTDCLDTLRSLELHGFNTKTIERRVLKLLSIKHTQEKVDEKKKEVHGQISELKHKNDKLVEDVYESARKIKFYKQQFTLALLEKEANDFEIATLMTSLDVIDTVMDSAPFDFVD